MGEKKNQIEKQLETAASTELRMPMMALASDTWYDAGQALDTSVQFSQW